MELEAYGHSKISIHALREEGDQRWQCVSVDGLGFLSTPSARRATAINLGSGAMRGDFYPRPPRGGRPGNTQAQTRRSTFLSTPSARRATTSATAISRKQRNFYPRPPRGGRPGQLALRRQLYNFYPRPPRGGRPLPFRAYVMIWQISIHALREEGDYDGVSLSK